MSEPAPALDRYGDPLPVGAVARYGSRRWKHRFDGDGGVLGCVFSPDGRLLAVAPYKYGEDRISLFEVPSGRIAQELRVADRLMRYSSIRFSADGRYLIADAGDPYLIVWDVSTGRLIPDWAGEPANESATGDWVYSFENGYDRKRVLLGGGRTAYLRRNWLGRSGILEVQSVTATPPIWSVPTSSEADIVACGRWLVLADTAEVRIFDGATGEPVRVLRLDPPASAPKVAAVWADRPIVAVASWRGLVQAWNGSTGESLCRTTRHFERVDLLAFSPDGKQLLASDRISDRAIVWDVATSEPQAEYRSEAFGPGSVVGVAGRFLAVRRREDGRSAVWDADQGGWWPGGEPAEWASLFHDPVGRYLLAGVRGLTAMWGGDPDGQWATVRMDVTDPGGGVLNRLDGWYPLGLSHDGRRFVAVSGGGAAGVFDTGSFTRVTELAGGIRPDALTTDGANVVFSRDGLRCALLTPVHADGSWPGTLEVSVWDAVTGELAVLTVYPPELPANTAHDIPRWQRGFDPAGRLLVARWEEHPTGDGGYDYTVLVDDALTARRVAVYRFGAVCPDPLAFSPDGRALAIAVDNTVELWPIKQPGDAPSVDP